MSEQIKKFSRCYIWLNVGQFYSRKLENAPRMLNEAADRIGCLLIQFKSKNEIKLACVYAMDNSARHRAYEFSNKTASGCKTGANVIFRGLCCQDEKYSYEKPESSFISDFFGWFLRKSETQERKNAPHTI